MNVVNFWTFPQRNFLSRKWFWIILALSIGATVFGYFKLPILGTIGQIVFGMILAPFVVLVVWFIVLSFSARRTSRVQQPQPGQQHGVAQHHGGGGQQRRTSWQVKLAMIALTIAAVVVTLWALGGIASFGKYLFASKPPTPAAVLGVKGTREVLIPFCEGVTPCPLTIPEGKFKIRTDGDPIRIKFQGIDHWVDYPGKGDFQVPTGVEPGEAQAASLDPKNLGVRVQVYRKVTVRQ